MSEKFTLDSSLMRRKMLKTLGVLPLASVATGCTWQNLFTQDKNDDESKIWQQANEIERSIVIPRFARQDFVITDYGAVAGDGTDCTNAINLAIETCHKAGGGRVYVPPGQFKTAAIHLKSQVNLHLAKGATLKFITDASRYLPAVLTRFEGVELYNYSPLIYALEQDNIAVTGRGTLDGGADKDTWWHWKGGKHQIDPNEVQHEHRKRLRQSAIENLPVSDRVYGEGNYLRPSFIQPYRCKNVLIDGVKIINAPMWVVHPVLSKNVTIRNLTINSLGPNNDGIDPESCNNVLISDCHLEMGDDCIAVKSGRDNDGRRVNTPCENIVIRRCKMNSIHGGIVIGSEVSGGVGNVFAEDCVVGNSPYGIRIKTNAIRGGYIRNIRVRNVAIDKVKKAVIRINLHYEKVDHGPYLPKVEGVDVRHLRVNQAKQLLSMRGFEALPIKSVHLSDIELKQSFASEEVEFVEPLSIEKVRIGGQEINLTALGKI